MVVPARVRAWKAGMRRPMLRASVVSHRLRDATCRAVQDTRFPRPESADGCPATVAPAKVLPQQGRRVAREGPPGRMDRQSAKAPAARRRTNPASSAGLDSSRRPLRIHPGWPIRKKLAGTTDLRPNRQSGEDRCRSEPSRPDAGSRTPRFCHGSRLDTMESRSHSPSGRCDPCNDDFAVSTRATSRQPEGGHVNRCGLSACRPVLLAADRRGRGLTTERRKRHALKGGSCQRKVSGMKVEGVEPKARAVRIVTNLQLSISVESRGLSDRNCRGKSEPLSAESRRTGRSRAPTIGIVRIRT